MKLGSLKNFDPSLKFLTDNDQNIEVEGLTDPSQYLPRHAVFIKNKVFHTEFIQSEDALYIGVIADKKYIELVSFCLMPNHFHLILHEISEGGISRYMQRLLNAYAKYFNTRHKRSGHLFSGPFRAIRVDNDEYLDYLSAYIHLNPKELNGWRNREVEYFWSSFQDLVDGNRWAQFLYTDIITDKFKNGKEYYDFVIETPIKEIKNELEEELLIDD